MWNTADGIRTIVGAEAILIRSTIHELVDASTGAIYREMLMGLEIEVEMQQGSPESHENDTIRREEVVAALNERRPEQNWPHSECVVMDQWETAVFEIQSWVLADEDWVMDDLIADQPPSQSDEIKSILGIGADYLLDIPPDVDSASAANIWADLIELVSGERPHESVFEQY
jgi:hypothetical protein